MGGGWGCLRQPSKLPEINVSNNSMLRHATTSSRYPVSSSKEGTIPKQLLQVCWSQHTTCLYEAQMCSPRDTSKMGLCVCLWHHRAERKVGKLPSARSHTGDWGNQSEKRSLEFPEIREKKSSLLYRRTSTGFATAILEHKLPALQLLESWVILTGHVTN